MSVKPSEETQIALIAKDVEYIKKAIDSFHKKFVTRDEFRPVRLIAYGGTGIILSGVLVAIIALVVK